MRILLIEDDTHLSSSVSRWLRSESYAVDMARDGAAGEELALTNEYDAIILDVMLPRQDGWVTLARVRKAGNLTPILMLTALGDVGSRIRGLDGGADDYLTKPFHGGELLARVRALARRRTDVRSTTLEYSGLQLDLTTHTATRDGRRILLTSKEFALLEMFLMHPDKILSRHAISEHLWDMNFDPRSNVVESFVRYLRQKVDRDFDRPLIHTLRGAGYMLSDRDPGRR